MQHALVLDGFCHGPLFAPRVRVRKVRQSGGKEIWAKWKAAEVPWSDRAAVRDIYRLSRETTQATGVQHSVEHIVPLKSEFVCGLHVPANLCVMPLLPNIYKSNKHWPQMWGEQGELF